jgi:hypothetical protein
MSSATTPGQVHALFMEVLDQVDPKPVLAQVGHSGPRTEPDFVQGLRAGDERARLVMVERLPRAGHGDLAVKLALAVVHCPQLHDQEPLMLICLRELVAIGGEEGFVAALPHSFRTWWTARLGLSGSGYDRRATAFMDYFEPTVELSDRPLAWPRLGEGEPPAPVGQRPINFDAIQDLFPTANEQEQSRMRAYARTAFELAPTRSLRAAAATTLLAIGEHTPLYEHGDDVLDTVRRSALDACLQRDPRGTFPTAFSDPDPKIQLLAVTTLLNEDPVWMFDHAADVLAIVLAAGRERGPVDVTGLGALIKGLYHTARDEASWVEREPRWITALGALRGETLGRDIDNDFEMILYVLPASIKRKYLKPTSKPKPAPRVWSGVDHGSAHWPQRYEAGEHLQVWREIRGAGDAFCDKKELGRAREVAFATMRRARANLWVLHERLLAIGYPMPERQRWLNRDDEPVPLLKKLARVGPVPPALEACFTVIGGVSFLPTDCESKPMLDLGVEILDPLVVWPAKVVKDDYEEWYKLASVARGREELRLHLSPDNLHKAEISGGPAYSVTLPDGSADPLVHWTDMSLVRYLRFAILERGGFPGLTLNEHGAQTLIAQLTESLQPF